MLRWHQVLAFWVLLAATAVTGADVLVMRDGRILYGEVVESSRRSVKFRYQIAGRWATVTFQRHQYDYYKTEPGDQSDADEQTQERGDGRRENVPVDTAPHGPVVAVIPLFGQVGGLVNRQVLDTFDADMLQACLDEAIAREAELVILDISSPGGLVDEMEMICEKIIDNSKRLRIVAFAREAYSAAAIISMSCREIMIRPDGQMGAAVIIKGAVGGRMTAVEAKYASVHHARQREYMSASGQPYEVVAAMTIQETVLWWSPDAGFRMTDPPAQEVDAWEQIDSASTILTMTARESVTWGVALDTARTPHAVARKLGLDEVEIVRLDDVAKRYLTGLDRKVTGLYRGFDNYFAGLGGMVSAMNAYAEAANRGDREAAGRQKSLVSRNRSKVMGAARRIRQIDRQPALARRISVHGKVLERLEEDDKLIGRISLLLSADKTEDFNEAAKRINEVLEEWRAILTG